jgi:hypothetical protein
MRVRVELLCIYEMCSLNEVNDKTLNNFKLHDFSVEDFQPVVSLKQPRLYLTLNFTTIIDNSSSKIGMIYKRKGNERIVYMRFLGHGKRLRK